MNTEMTVSSDAVALAIYVLKEYLTEANVREDWESKLLEVVEALETADRIVIQSV